MATGKASNASEGNLSHSQKFLDHAAIFGKVSDAIGIAKDKIKAGHGDKAIDLLDVAQDATVHAKEKIMEHVHRMTDAPISRMSRNEDVLKNYRRKLFQWQRGACYVKLFVSK